MSKYHKINDWLIKNTWNFRQCVCVYCYQTNDNCVKADSGFFIFYVTKIYLIRSNTWVITWESFRECNAQFSNISAASNRPCRRYSKLRFFNVVVIVGASTRIDLYQLPCPLQFSLDIEHDEWSFSCAWWRTSLYNSSASLYFCCLR